MKRQQKSVQKKELLEQLKKIKQGLGEEEEEMGSEMGEDEMFEMGSEMGEDEMEEMGEDEVEERQKDDDIDYNTVMPENEVESSDSEEDIIASTIKSRKAPGKVSELDPSVSKKQKTESNYDISHSLKKDQEALKSELAEIRDKMGKSAIPDERHSGPAEVEFEYVAPSEAYFHIIRTLLNSYLDGKEQEDLLLSDMSDHILERASIGCVLASSLGKEDPERNPKYQNLSDEEFDKVVLQMNQKRDVYGITTILSLSKSKDKQAFLKQINDYVMKKANKYADDISKKLESIISSKNVGLLVNERLVNIPPLAVPNMHTQLPDDLEFTKEQDDIDDPKEFNYDYLLVLTKFTIPNEIVGKALDSGSFIPKRQDRLYYRWEDDIFEASADLSFCYQGTFKEVDDEGNKSYIQGPCSQSGGGKETQYRLIYLIKWSEYVKKLPVIQQLVKQ